MAAAPSAGHPDYHSTSYSCATIGTNHGAVDEAATCHRLVGGQESRLPARQAVEERSPAFTVLNDMFARDSSRVCLCKGSDEGGGRRATDLRGSRSRLRASAADGSRRVYAGYARDATRVYFADLGGSLRASDGRGSANVPQRRAGIWLDSKSVFRHGKRVGWRIKGVKPEGFEILNEHYARTVDAVIFGGGKIEGAIPAEFRIIDEYRGRDSKHTYAGGRAEEKPAFSIGGYEFRYQRNSTGSGALWTLVFIVTVFAGMLVWLYEKLTWWRHRDEETPAVEDPERLAKLRQLAAALANGDAESAETGAAGHRRHAGIHRAIRRRGNLSADEPDYAALLENADEDPSPYWVLPRGLHESRHLFGIIDWRSGTDETIEPGRSDAASSRGIHRFRLVVHRCARRAR